MRVFAYKKLKAILDLETIVCLMRTLLYGEIEIHATQCQTIRDTQHRLRKENISILCYGCEVLPVIALHINRHDAV